MESSNSISHPKIKIAFAVACLAAVSLYFAAQHHRKRRGRKQSKQKSSSTGSSCYLKSETTKPQHAFKKVLADNSYSPFKHLKLSDSNADRVPNSHPYEDEVKSLLDSPRIDFSFFHGDFYGELSDLCVWVEAKSQLQDLVDVLSREKVFAVDTEQHSLRSFLGFTALVQISTWNEDYLIDTIALHDSISMLRPVFADPTICKVFHGADNDVLWLQRDFHIYVVNLFDTAKACDVLSKPQKSLAYLLETYCGVMTNKKLQLEDWRQRPLPIEMVVYARIDAHYLLYIAKCLIDELRERENGLQVDNFHLFLEACRRSNLSCLQLYSKDKEAYPGESAASSIVFRHLPNQQSPESASLPLQFQVLVIRLCAWRDLMARLHDESLRWVLSDQAISALVNNIPEDELAVYEIIKQADQSTDSSASILSIPSPSPIIYSHWEDLCSLKDSPNDLDDFLQWIFQRCLGSGGTCPLSIYNYALLSWSNLKCVGRIVPKKNAGKQAKHVGRKASRDLFVKKFSCKAPVYHNCKIYASDSRLLCHCDRRKLEWYLQRKLAKLIDDNPPAIMLLFEPKGRPEDEDNDFYIQSKKNMCVGCGEKNHYLRYRIIPSCYRMHFPEHLKSHRSHDIVLLCVDCHEVAHAAAERYKRQIASEFGIPLFVRRVADSGDIQMASESSSSPAPEEGVSPLQLRTAAMALLRHGPRMPSDRREELMETVKKYYGGRDISPEDLERALLVGMSPSESRKFAKKRGLYSNQSSAAGLPDEKLQNKADNPINSSKPSPVSKSLSNEGQASSEVACNNPSMKADEKRLLSGLIDESISNMDDNHRGRHTLNGAVDPFIPKSDKNVSMKHRMKVSLLGHGPHGKEVVDHLLKDYGEEGIQQFCQRWRQVFVDAIHPQHLPAGWDVKHSGRRDFGEFSVYNPAKSASVAFEDSV